MNFQKLIMGGTLSRRTSIITFICGLIIMISFRSILKHYNLPMSLSTIVSWLIFLLIPFVHRPVVFGLVTTKAAISIFSILSSNRPGGPENGIVANLCNLIAGIIFAEILYRIICGLRKMNHQLKKESERALAASEAKATFLANMSHEIRTPISGIRGITDMLLAEDRCNECDNSHLQMIKSSSDVLLHIVNNVLDYSSIEAGKVRVSKSPFKIRMVLTELISSLRTTIGDKNVQLYLDIDDSIPNQVMTDGMMIQQIVSNLVSNGIKFTDRGSVVVSIGRDLDIAGNITIKVCDTGVGIPKEKQELIFTEFERILTSYEKTRQGTGLGLTITRGLVEKLGGSISVDSSRGEGSRFTVSIPMDDISEAAECEKTQAMSLIKRPVLDSDVISILLAEDNEVNQTYIRHFLEKVGYKLTIVDNGEKAIEMFHAQNFHLILMDIQMPVKSGLQATKEIREFEEKMEKIKTPILALTASVTEHEQKLFLESGMDAVCPKPVDMKELMKTLESYLPSAA